MWETIKKLLNNSSKTMTAEADSLVPSYGTANIPLTTMVVSKTLYKQVDEIIKKLFLRSILSLISANSKIVFI